MNNESNITMPTKLTQALVRKCLAATWFVILSTSSVLGFSTNNGPLEAFSLRAKARESLLRGSSPLSLAASAHWYYWYMVVYGSWRYMIA